VKAAVTGLVAAVLVFAGCGGDGGGDRLSREEFVSRADAICTRYEAKLDALGQPQNVEELSEFADKAVPIAEDGREELGELRPPENLQATYDAWLEQGDKAIDVVKRLRDAANDGDQAEIERIAEEAGATDREANRLAGELGFEQCGASGSPAP
jgi:hypothetical protein